MTFCRTNSHFVIFFFFYWFQLLVSFLVDMNTLLTKTQMMVTQIQIDNLLKKVGGSTIVIQHNMVKKMWPRHRKNWS